MKINSIVLIIITLVIGTGAFYAGMMYQQNKQPTFQTGARAGGQAVGRNRMGGRQTTGEIISQDDKSITVKLQDGSTKIVLFAGTTTVNKASQGSINDLKIGERVAVFGTENTDGSMIAQNIQLRVTDL